MKIIPIGEALKEYGYLTDEQLDKALEYQKSEEGKGKRLGDVLLELGFVTQKQVLDVLGKKLELPLVNLDDQIIQNEALMKIPKAIAKKYNAVPISINNNRLTIAMSDPLDFYAREDIKQISGMPVDIVLAETEPIKSAISRGYSEVGAKIVAQKANITAKPENDMPELVIDEDGDDDVPVIRLINSLLARGQSAGASDIHIEPFDDQTIVRMRIDGLIVDYVTVSKSLHASLVARIKIMSNLDIAEKRVPQDGNFRAKLPDNIEINIRVSIIPTIHGEKVVMRYLATNSSIDHSGTFGMNMANYQTLERMLNAPNGIIYITGPTGSGKTTTLYMVLEELAKRAVNISTIEDPVEKSLPRINQMSVNNLAGLTFSTGLRALLRQDPDIIMLGETRDAETADISVRAAITGHLVLSTLHTNDAVSSIV